jgi:hypothetical protein
LIHLVTSNGWSSLNFIVDFLGLRSYTPHTLAKWGKYALGCPVSLAKVRGADVEACRS